MKPSAFVRRHAIWASFVAAAAPLLLLLALQYWWLVRLERASAAADRTTLENFLAAVSTQLLYDYGTLSERTLSPPAALFAPGSIYRVADYYRKRETGAARILFAVLFRHDDWGDILFYDPRSGTMRPAEPSGAQRAVRIACSPWKLLSDKGVEIDVSRPVVEERDPDNRLILNPVIDQYSRVVGVAGMVLDEEHFGSTAAPEAIRALLPRHLREEALEEVVVTVRDREGRLVHSSRPEADRPEAATARFSYVFADWTIGVGTRRLTPEQWAHSEFLFNLALSVLTAAVLVGGVLLALRTASREMRLVKMKGDFLSNVSHELRTPLASIRVFGELLRLGRAKTPEKVREYGEFIESESRRLTQLVNNILDFARIEAGQKEYSFRTGDPLPALEEILRTFRIGLAPTGQPLVYESPEEPLPPVRHDPDALAQALHNLLDNAVKYSSGRGTITVRAARRNGSVALSVSDEGIGIPQEERERIFDRFHRVGTGLVHDVRGSGLGLALVRHIVAAHGGRVTVDSEPGRGSTFTILLPAEREEPRGADGRPPRPIAAGSGGG